LGFVIENLLSCLPVGITPWFYRTSAGAEIDLVVKQNNKKKYAIEIKRSMTPSLSKGFHLGCEDIEATHRFIVYPGKERNTCGVLMIRSRSDQNTDGVNRREDFE